MLNEPEARLIVVLLVLCVLLVVLFVGVKGERVGAARCAVTTPRRASQFGCARN